MPRYASFNQPGRRLALLAMILFVGGAGLGCTEEGDTIIVKARIVEEQPTGLIIQTVPSLSASFSVDGVQVAIDGSAMSGHDEAP